MPYACCSTALNRLDAHRKYHGTIRVPQRLRHKWDGRYLGIDFFLFWFSFHGNNGPVLERTDRPARRRTRQKESYNSIGVIEWPSKKETSFAIPFFLISARLTIFAVIYVIDHPIERNRARLSACVTQYLIIT